MLHLSGRSEIALFVPTLPILKIRMVGTARFELTTRKIGCRQTLPLAGPLQAHIAKLDGRGRSEGTAPPQSRRCFEGRWPFRSPVQSVRLPAGSGRLAHRRRRRKGDARAKYELSFHSLRHTATSLLVMDYIGHDSADVSHGYTHTGREALEKAAAAFPVL